MKKLNIKKLKGVLDDACEIPARFELEGMDYHLVDCVNWASEYPYAPHVEVAIAYTDEAFLLHWRVTEDSVRAAAVADNGPVWEDSCVEFFIQPAHDGIYYNIECNCAGTLLIGAGTGRHDRIRATQDVLDKVSRWASLGRTAFEERMGTCSWQIAEVIPFSAFFQHEIKTLDGQSLRANFYKCGDKLSRPHFLSWSPISLPKPDFHCPAFFGELCLE